MVLDPNRTKECRHPRNATLPLTEIKDCTYYPVAYVTLMTHRHNIDDSRTSFLGSRENTDGVHRPPYEGRLAHPISVLSVRFGSKLPLYHFILTFAHSDDITIMTQVRFALISVPVFA